jgi:hypothetical protein
MYCIFLYVFLNPFKGHSGSRRSLQPNRVPTHQTRNFKIFSFFCEKIALPGSGSYPDPDPNQWLRRWHFGGEGLPTPLWSFYSWFYFIRQLWYFWQNEWLMSAEQKTQVPSRLISPSLRAPRRFKKRKFPKDASKTGHL